MLIASLALLAVAALTATLIFRRRSVTSDPGAFKARIRVSEGAVGGLSSTWRGGYGRWVRDVLVWRTAPLLVRTTLVPVEGVDTAGIHGAGREARHVGKDPVLLPFVTEDHGHIEVVVSATDRDSALGPFAHAIAVGSLVKGRLSPLREDP